MMDITEAPAHRRDFVGALAGPKWPTRVTGRLELVPPALNGREWALRWELPITYATVPITREKE